MDPALPAPAAHEHPRAAHQGLAGVREVRDLGQAAAARAPAVGARPPAGRAPAGPSASSTGPVAARARYSSTGGCRSPASHRATKLDRRRLVEPLADRRRQRRRPGRDGRLVRRRPSRARPRTGPSAGGSGRSSSARRNARSCTSSSALVEPQELRGERMALEQLPGPAPAPGPGLHRARRDGEPRHQIFSMLTRNALNSGVRELASPTNGVSALASQLAPLVGSRSAAMPTKPQWIGMPM